MWLSCQEEQTKWDVWSVGNKSRQRNRARYPYPNISVKHLTVVYRVWLENMQNIYIFNDVIAR